MKKLLLIGDNISYSLSPLIHNSALDYFNLSSEIKYELLQISPLNFNEKIKEILKDETIIGFNVTTPYKHNIINFLDDVEPFVKNCKSCNVVVKDKNKWIGKNTDAYGFIMPLLKRKIDLNSKKILIFGAGGVVRAILFLLINYPIEKITIINRDMLKIEQIINDIKKISLEFLKKISFYSYDELKIKKLNSIIIMDSNIIINATSSYGGNDLPIDLNLDYFNSNQIIYELSYTQNIDEKNALKFYATKKNATYINGIEMLLHQAIASFKLWLSKKPPYNLLFEVTKNYIEIKNKGCNKNINIS